MSSEWTGELQPEEVTRFLELAQGDPRRRQLLEDPRYQAVLAAFEAFENPTDVPAGADPVAAAARLADAWSAPDEHADARSPVTIDAPRRGFWTWLTAPVLRPVLALAAVLIVVGVFLGRDRGPDVDVGGESFTPRATTVVPEEPLALFPAQVDVDAREVTLSWRPMDGATAYQVRILTPSYIEVERYDPTPETSITVPIVRWPSSERSWPNAFYQVLALRDGESIGDSVVGSYGIHSRDL